MFRRSSKKENKAKLEHKLYLARESPEPVFDLADCGIHSVPSGIYSLCRVFLKEALFLADNNLTSLAGGGNLKDLHLLKVLDVRSNELASLPNEIACLTSLQELHASGNSLKKLPSSLCDLKNLQVLDVSNNNLQSLPDNIGGLINLRELNVEGNKRLKSLPKSLAKAQRLNSLRLDAANFVYPPPNVAESGSESILQFICHDVGCEYDPSKKTSKEDSPNSQGDGDVQEDSSQLQAKIWKLEKIKEQKMLEFLAIERNNELSQRQELELANALKADRIKLLENIAQEQHRFDLELAKIQQEREIDKFRLIEQLQSVEQNADVAIKQLLMINREPLAQLIEQEQLEEERMLATVIQGDELRKNDILSAMQDLLEQETDRFRQLDEDRAETTRSILEQELQSNTHLSDVLQTESVRKHELISKLQEDSDLQKAAVGALLERGDARSWGLIQQVRLVESQLAALTSIEMDRRKLEIDEQINDLAEKRANLSILLMDLLEQQSLRRTQLISTLNNLLEVSNNADDDFWLRHYQLLLDRMPQGHLDIQRNMKPALAEALLMAGVIHCLPFLAKWSHSEHELLNVTEEDLKAAGIRSSEESRRILDAFHMYKKQQEAYSQPYRGPAEPSAPMSEEASAPPPEAEASAPSPTEGSAFLTNECVVCLDLQCQIIFVPCGHFCCCAGCSNPVLDCPLCRTRIERKIRVVAT